MQDPCYFPMVMDIREKAFLLVGGGVIACEKFSRIREWTNNISIVALEISDSMQKMADESSVKIEHRAFAMSDLDSIDIVIVAVNDLGLQRDIFYEATRRKILCNAVDLAEYCHFIFPSVIRKGDLIVAISTSGASPAFAKYLRRFFEKLIPLDIGNFLAVMRDKRATMPKGKDRMQFLDIEAQSYMKQMAEYAKKTLNT
ncbi:bifunctional precorrin-2 dehydrogenase/sirohydrochlorin ferrochelatase [Sulfuricurvum sp.]|uniref:precorrin-2 dehydrogenase/sirohydrochlorin ferrochelatase family protein n=1 Tax=Sulfuricurvum sp. TaxID=2025608 RepID=UPI0035641189